MADTPQRSGKRFKRLIYIFAPFLLLLLTVVILNWHSSTRMASTGAGSEQADQAVPTDESMPSTAVTNPTPADNTDVATIPPAATAVPLPTLSPEYNIRVVGPPAESIFTEDSEVAFYWNWPDLLPDAYAFILVISGADDSLSVEGSSEPNLGSGYRITVPANALPPGEYHWSVKLIGRYNEDLLRESEQRLLVIAAAPDT